MPQMSNSMQCQRLQSHGDIPEQFELRVNVSNPNQHHQYPHHSPSRANTAHYYNPCSATSNNGQLDVGSMTEKLDKMEYDMIVIRSILDDYTINHAKGQLSSRDHAMLKSLTSPKPKPCPPPKECLQSLLVIDDNCCNTHKNKCKSQDAMCGRTQTQCKPECKRSTNGPMTSMNNLPRNNPSVICTGNSCYRPKPPVPPPCPDEMQYDPCDLNYTDSNSNCDV